MPKISENEIGFLLRMGALSCLTQLSRKGSMGFNELLKSTHLTPATLAERLKELTILGLVNRKVEEIESNPWPRYKISYELTPLGKQVLEVLKQLIRLISESKSKV
jgi:DNA-binding HxlR family transcriptional regulator